MKPHPTVGLPKWGPFNTDRFPGVVVCVRCHTAGEHAMRDAAGADVSPVAEVDASMMALSARDPYFLAALQRELEHAPDAKAAEQLCLRCHAPVGYAESVASSTPLTLADLEHGTSDMAGLAREGVGCAGCHAMQPDGLGDESTFVARAHLSFDRIAYGALPRPADDAMVAMIKTRAIPSAHVTTSELCASCHTVIVPAAGAGGGEIAEQATYLEWRATPRTRTCQDCHQPAIDNDTAFSTRPPSSPARAGLRRHAIRGGSAYLLARLAAHADWLGAAATPVELAASAADTDRFLATSARVEIARDGSAVTVVNLTGHKLPTGYPTRRMWLHVVARDAAGKVLLESGATRDGTIVGAGGKRLDMRYAILPHVDRIASADDACVWEAVPVDAHGRRTHLLLGVAKIVKDDRILPDGYTPAPRTEPVGTQGDADFVAGRDTVHLALPAGTAKLDVELLYQAIPTETLESYNPKHAEAAQFLAIADVPPAPQVIATASWAR